MKRIIAAFSILFTVFVLSGQTELKTTSVSVFKNGSAFFLKKGSISTQEGTCFLEDIPNAAFGTLWFSNDELNRIVTKTEKTEESKTISSSFRSCDFKDLLSTNLNQPVSIHIYDDTITGRVEKIDDNYFILNTGNKWINLKTNHIRFIEFDNKPIFPDSTTTRVETKTKVKKGLLLTFNSEKPLQELELMYMEKGIGWLPTYHLHLINDTDAYLTLQAVVSNNAEPIVEAEMNFVVGVINFVYANHTSPLAGGTMDLDRFLSVMKSTSQSTRLLDFANRGSSRRLVQLAESSEVKSLEGRFTEDMFSYTLPNVTLEKGARALYKIFETKVPVEHIYEVRLQASTEERSSYRSRDGQSFSFEPNFKNKVWHTIKFKNNSSSPLTSGPVMVTNAVDSVSEPISQDKIYYTPLNAETFLKLTAAPNISVRDFEKEVNRERIKLKGRNCIKITIKGEIQIKNFKDKAVKLMVRRMITGELQKSKPEWSDNAKQPYSGALNEQTDVNWNLKLKKNESTKVSYQYTIIVND